MSMYIRIDENNNIVDHPLMKDNLLYSNPEIDYDNLPSWLVTFNRVEKPLIDPPYKVYINCTYEWDGDIVTDVHNYRDMTQEERVAKQNATRAQFAAESGFDSWTFDEDLCKFLPPTPYPAGNQPHEWRESTLEWVRIPLETRPVGGFWRFDLETEQWVEVISTLLEGAVAAV